MLNRVSHGTKQGFLLHSTWHWSYCVRQSISHLVAADPLREAEARVMAFLRERKEITPQDMKDLLGISRKYAIPLLEYLDAQRITVRVGD